LRQEYDVQEGTYVITLSVVSGDDRIRDSLGWRLGHGFPEFDVIASEGSTQFRLRSPELDPNQIAEIRARIDRMVARLNEFHPSWTPLEVAVAVER
jgi:hypothetical protein